MAVSEQAYERWRDRSLADPENRPVYAEESAKMVLWLRLVEARTATGVSRAQVAERLGVFQAQVARIEKGGYDAHSLNTLRRYVAALGGGFSLRVSVEHTSSERAVAAASEETRAHEQRTRPIAGRPTSTPTR